jgi:3-oxoadipate enol-lactonase
MQVLAEDGTRIDARISGEKCMHAVVLIHGFPLTHAIWEAHADALATSHFVIVPDLRGAGASSAPQGPYLMETHAADVAAILDALNVERAALIGHSMGGYVSLAFARMFTERVAGIALVASRLRADTPQEAAARYELAARVEIERSVEPVVSAYIPRLLAERTRREMPAVTKRVYEIARSNDEVGVAAALRGIAMRAPADDIAEELDVPMVMVAGGQDVVVGLEEARVTAELFPNGRLVVCPQSGHLPMLEEPDCVRAALEQWLEGAGAA